LSVPFGPRAAELLAATASIAVMTASGRTCGTRCPVRGMSTSSAPGIFLDNGTDSRSGLSWSPTTDPKQPISPPQLRTGACASQRVELLAEREVLEDQFVMSVAGPRQGADANEDHLQHASILSFYEQRSNHHLSGSDCGEGQPSISVPGVTESLSVFISRSDRTPSCRTRGLWTCVGRCTGSFSSGRALNTQA
jgi:hypothetical protein